MIDFYSIDKFESFADFLRKALAREKITKKLFSEKIRASYAIVNNWTSGKSLPKKDYRIRIAQYFNLSIEDIDKLIEKQKRKDKNVKKSHNKYKNPFPTVDIIIENSAGKVVLIERKNYPYGWALPGGFVEYGESLENAALREAKEETNLDVKILFPFKAYSSPDRDPRFHTITYVFVGKGKGKLRGKDDAKNAKWFGKREIKNLEIAFDHRRIIDDYFKFKEILKEKGLTFRDIEEIYKA